LLVFECLHVYPFDLLSDCVGCAVGLVSAYQVVLLNLLLLNGIVIVVSVVPSCACVFDGEKVSLEEEGCPIVVYVTLRLVLAQEYFFVFAF
jgi:hypothetical protein